jgi:diguanylate cyclase (GGDEF)-like protein/PAS domain S-box-containing protein
MSDNSEKIKFRIIVPMVIVGIILVAISLTGGYLLQKNAIDDSVHERISGVHGLFNALLLEETQAINSQIDFLKSQKILLASFLAGDRSTLLDNAKPLFEKMQSKYHITHFYFHNTDKICFLRVHSPNRNGDLIDRYTLSESVSKGKPSHGIELGPLGTFTLRVVHPWFVENRLQGYIELGMEIEHITQTIKQALNAELLIVIEKKFLDKDDWKTGQKMLNRQGIWDLFEDFVIIDQTMKESPILDEKLSWHRKEGCSVFTAKLGQRHYKGGSEKLIDAGGQNVGEIISLVDVTAQQKALTKMILIVAGFSLVIGSGLFLLFNNYIGRIQKQLITSRIKLLTEIELRHQKEKELIASEKRFRSLFEESKDAIVSTDKNGNFQMINPAGRNMFGLTDSESKSINFRDLYVDKAMARRFSVAIHEKGYIRDLGVQLHGKDGKIMDCLMTVTSKLSDDKTFIGYEGIIRDVTPFKTMENELRRLATIDSLTDINNRRYFLELAQKEMKRSKRYKHPFSLIMLDIDHFKKINDTYSHSAGDQVLSEFSGVCLNELREADIMGRVGGEEFAAVIVESDIKKAMIVAERIRKAVSSFSVIIDREKIRFTVSIGVTDLHPNDDLNSIFERVDRAMYQAKEKGRNQVRTSKVKS